MVSSRFSDVIVVGGGSAGCVLAARLSEDAGRSVLLLEAGPDYPDLSRFPDVLRGSFGNSVHESEYNWHYRGRYSQTHDHLSPVVRGRVIGGSSSVNGCIFLRGAPEDFDSWASPSWTWERVLPHYRKLETDYDFADLHLHGGNGPMPVRRDPPGDWLPFQAAFYRAALKLGFPPKADLNDPAGSGVGPLPRNNPGGVRINCAEAYLAPARSRSNLTVRGDSFITRIVVDQGRAVGVEVANGRTTTIEAAGEVIVCAGAIATPQLLMLSGIGPEVHLREVGISVVNNLPGVGQNLQDHPVVSVRLVPKPAHLPRLAEPRLQLGLICTSRDSLQRNDLQITPTSSHPGQAHGVTGAVEPNKTLSLIAALEVPDSTGELRLASNDILESPLIEYRYLAEPRDRRRMREGVRLCVDLLRTGEFSEIVSNRTEPTDDVVASDSRLDDWIAQTLNTSSHTCGTCRIGVAEDALAVVDDGGRVRGMDGLRLADLSIAPAVVRANPNATAILIGEVVSDLVRAGAIPSISPGPRFRP